MPRPSLSSFDGKYIYPKLDKITPYFCRNNISPNLITISAIPLIILLYYAMINHYYASTLILVIIIRVIDCLDGTVARQCKKTSTIGSYLDTLVDILSFTAFAYGYVGSFYSNYTTRNTLGLIFTIVSSIVLGLVDPGTHHIKNQFASWCEQNSVLCGVLVWTLWVLFS